MMEPTEATGPSITMADAVYAAIRRNNLSMFIHLPGVVVSFDPATQTATIQPSIDRELTDGTLVKLPELSDVPIVFPRAAAGGLSFPLAEGDHVLLVFSQRSLDKWKTEGPGFPPSDNRLFDISDAFAIPGAYPPSEPLDPPPEGFDIRGTKVKIKGDESIDLQSPLINLSAEGSPTDPAVLGSVLQKNLEDLIKAIEDLISALTQVSTPASGPIMVQTTGSAAAQTGFGHVLPTATAAVSSALASVKAALPNENSEVVQIE